MGYCSKDEALEEDRMPPCVYDCNCVLSVGACECARKCVCHRISINGTLKTPFLRPCTNHSLLILANTGLTKQSKVRKMICLKHVLYTAPARENFILGSVCLQEWREDRKGEGLVLD